MHACVYVIIGPTGDINTETAKALAPFDESRTVPRYKVHLDTSGVRMMAEHYHIPETDLPALAKKMPDWMDCPGDVDHLGLFYWSDANPDARWDWYVIGGRWDGYLQGRPTRHDPFDENRAELNVLTTNELRKVKDLKERMPFAVVTPAGEWLGCETSVRFLHRFGLYRQRDAEWLKRVRKVLHIYSDYRVVCVDIHY